MIASGDTAARVRLALGPEPLTGAAHLLLPITLPPRPAATPPGPFPPTEFVIDLQGVGCALDEIRVREVFSPRRRAALSYPRVWGKPAARDRWLLIEEAGEVASARYAKLALSWDLTTLLSEGAEAARELGSHAVQASRAAAELGCEAVPRTTPEGAARRSEQLFDLRLRFGRAVEMRLMPAGRPFPARDVWRAAYALGLQWGDLDLFHWQTPDGIRLFTLSAVGQPGYFLPERAAEGEGVAGVALGFELPYSPAPVSVYDRMALALAFLRQQLGGRPTTREGRVLDAEALDETRDDLETMTAEMSRLGVPPGSPDAARFF